jgi:hypothetical protein
VSSGRPPGGSIILRYALALIMVVVGVVALNLGIGSLNDNDVPGALLWFSIVIVTLGFVSFSILRVRRGFSLMPLSSTKMLSVVICPPHTFKQMKNFALGDYVSKQEGKCSQCGNPTLFISGIYSEDLKKK